ncbi:MAG: translocation/assembly module TamB domain-containing protein [Bacteroidaceae bacterium]|nr:translocation/assembly module TamB domain-containing protein [Bacteroidaceae bacterium]
MIGGILILYLCLIILVNIPSIQQTIGGWVADILSEQIGTEVRIGKVKLGLLNRLILDDVYIADQSKKKLISIDRTSVKIDLVALTQGKVRVSNAQLFGPTLHVRKATPDDKTNLQFLIDAFSEDDEDSNPIDVRINSFIMRRGHVTYDVLSEAQQATLDPNHLDIDRIDITMSLRALSEDSLNLTIKRLNGIEKHSGLELKSLQAQVEANKQQGRVTDFQIEMPQSSLNIDTLTASYANYEKDKSFEFATEIQTADITPDDFKSLMPRLESLTTPLHLSTKINGSQERINVERLTLQTIPQSLTAQLNGSINNLQTADQKIHIDIQQLSMNNEAKAKLFQFLSPNDPMPAIVDNIGRMDYRGTIDKTSGQLMADGTLISDAGNARVNLDLTDGKVFKAHTVGDDINIGQLMDSPDFGTTSFDLTMNGQITNQQPEGTIQGKINTLEYNGHQYNNITLDATRKDGMIKGMVNSADELARFDLDGSYDERNSRIAGTLNLHHLSPHTLNLVKGMEGQSLSMNADVDIHGNNLNSLLGNIDINNLSIHDKENTVNLEHINLNISQEQADKSIDIKTDFAEAHLCGQIELDGIVDAFKNQVASHLPSLVQHTRDNRNRFAFDATLTESDFLKHFIETDYVIDQPVNIKGYIDAVADTMTVDIEAPRISNNNNVYVDTHVLCTNSHRMMSASLNTRQRQENTVLSYLLTADAKDDKLETFINWEDRKNNMTNGTVYATTVFSDIQGKVNADVNIHKSQVTLNDTIWQVAPSHLQYYDKRIVCEDVKMYKENQSIVLNGAISEKMSDSLIVDLDNIEVAYITDIVDFDAVSFQGQASGRAQISNVYDDIHLNANLIVNNMHLQEGRLGTGHIQAYWDSTIKGMRVNGHITDFYKNLNRTTDVEGFISPSQNDIDLKITTHDTNAEFLNGFLSSTFRNFKGRTNGVLHVIGPLNDVNLVGDICADVAMTLRATNVQYHINPSDTLHLRPYAFLFNNIRLTDDQGNTGIVNGTLAHKNMKNFKYDFVINTQNLTIYDEHEFNSDKFYATVYADATLEIHGSDGHPLRMTADVTPTRGSVFAYDAATPDAINTGSFVEFRDMTPHEAEPKKYLLFNESDKEDWDEEDTNEASDIIEYQGDIFMDISIHVNPDCEIKLRMDNVEDGYMSTYGSGTLLAHYHNKSPFSLNGIYQIDGGRYRLYLQDIIFRDLDLQQGSNVEFNGNPFDANIHLICHHILNAVPLQDITAGYSIGSNNKVKVICVLDITGKLGNMNFGFDIQLPNVNDETRQLVKSLISTEDEMNMQMIYLLGLGRFYSNEYARAAGESGSNQAVNTLLSSTISGQINQMLSNVIGQDSKWNFGTGLSTGEKGWNDLDVEGILSGRLLDDRLLINGNFGYRDNALTNTANFIGDFDVKWRLTKNGKTFIKAYNQTNDRYFTKTTLNTQGIGITYQRDFDSWKALFRRKMKEENMKNSK